MKTWPSTIPLWVLEQSGMTPRVLDYWRELQFIAAERPGTGNRYPWHHHVDQLMWLAGLHKIGKIIDREDADAGYRLRATTAHYAVRVDDRPWSPITVTNLHVSALIDNVSCFLLSSIPRGVPIDIF